MNLESVSRSSIFFVVMVAMALSLAPAPTRQPLVAPAPSPSPTPIPIDTEIGRTGDPAESPRKWSQEERDRILSEGIYPEDEGSN